MDETEILSVEFDSLATNSYEAEFAAITNVIRELTVQQQLQDFCDLFGYNDQIIWDQYEKNEKDALERKVRLSFMDDSAKTEIEIRKSEEKIKALVKALWAQRKFNGGSLLMAIVPIITVDYESYRDNIDKALASKHYNIHCLFRVRKCTNKENSNNCCMLFVDENARVYQNWKDYVKCNRLPKVVIVSPKKGIFMTNEFGEVLLEVFASPKCNLATSILQVADTSSALASLGATATVMGAIVVPPTLPLTAMILGIASTAIGVSSALYSVVRSSMRLSDRAKHEESIALNNREARGLWLAVAGGVAGMAAASTPQLLGVLVRNGAEIGKAVRTAVDVFNMVALTTNGLGVINGFLGFYLKLRDGEEITSLDLVQMGASLFLFTHSVYNFKTASQIIDAYQARSIIEFRNKLHHTQRESFKLVCERTIEAMGKDAGQRDIIRHLNNNPDTTQTFCNVYKMHENNLVDQMIVSFQDDGQVQTNLLVPTDITDTSSYFPADITGGNDHGIRAFIDSESLKCTIAILAMTYKVFSNTTLETTITNLVQTLKSDSYNEILELVREFIKDNGDSLEKNLKRIIPFEEFLSTAFKVIRSLANDEIDINEYIKQAAEKKYGLGNIYCAVLKYFLEFKPSGKQSGKCEDCGGCYYVNVKLDDDIVDNETKNSNDDDTENEPTVLNGTKT